MGPQAATLTGSLAAAFLGSYAAALGFDSKRRQEALERAACFAIVRLIEFAYEDAAAAGVSTPLTASLLTWAHHLAQDPMIAFSASVEQV
jgi:hypothetical protein